MHLQLEHTHIATGIAWILEFTVLPKEEDLPADGYDRGHVGKALQGFRFYLSISRLTRIAHLLLFKLPYLPAVPGPPEVNTAVLVNRTSMLLPRVDIRHQRMPLEPDFPWLLGEPELSETEYASAHLIVAPAIESSISFVRLDQFVLILLLASAWITKLLQEIMRILLESNPINRFGGWARNSSGLLLRTERIFMGGRSPHCQSSPFSAE